MRLPESKIELAASTEESRYTLKAVKLDVEHKRIMATDGHILAIVPCEVTAQDHSVLIPTDSMKQLRAMQKRSKSVPVEIHTNGKIEATGKAEQASFEVMQGQFPNVDMVVPKYDSPLVTIRLNAELLYKLAQAITPAGESLIVSLTIKDSQSSVLVKTSKNEDAIGVIMPCRELLRKEDQIVVQNDSGTSTGSTLRN